jgi:SAM-dependent methyltransferase
MTTPFTYDFGYSWPITWGLLIPVVLFGALAAAGLRLKWRRWVVITSALVVVWGIVGLLITHALFRINLPVPPLTDRFASSGSGRFVDIGAGSGRATIGLLLARPRAHVTAVDVYRGYYGIDDNRPERLIRNASIAGIADRVSVVVGDARALPLETGAFDGVISVAAIDHLPRAGIPKALAEAARVLKPRGELLLAVVNVDWWARIASPHALGHHPRTDPGRWRTLLESAGFNIIEQGTQPAVLYFLCRRSAP